MVGFVYGGSDKGQHKYKENKKEFVLLSIGGEHDLC